MILFAVIVGLAAPVAACADESVPPEKTAAQSTGNLILSQSSEPLLRTVDAQTKFVEGALVVTIVAPEITTTQPVLGKQIEMRFGLTVYVDADVGDGAAVFTIGGKSARASEPIPFNGATISAESLDIG